MKRRLFTCLTIAAGCLAASVSHAAEPKQKQRPAARKPNPVFAPVEDVAGLPRVLLLGDSISIGYTLGVRKLLQGKANVHRANGNCGPTNRGLEKIEDWLGTGGSDKKWDLIHFNWGLHDLKYVNPKGDKLVDVGAEGSRQQTPIDDYTANLDKLVKRLKKTGAKLVWCTTTPVPEGAQGRVVDDVLKYNAAAAKVMEQNKVDVDDLYAFAKPILGDIQRPANVHFTPEGSKKLAGQVAAVIERTLAD